VAVEPADTVSREEHRLARLPGRRPGGLAGYYLLPDTVRVVAASSALLHYGAAVAVVVGIRLHRPADPWPWYLIGTALLAFGTGDAIQFATTVGDLSDVCFLAAYLALTVALLRLVRTRSRGRDVPALLDALVVSTGLGLVAWQFLMFPYARDPSLTLDQKLTSIVLPLADVVLLTVLVRLWSGGGQRPAAYWLLGLSVVALLAADAAFGVVILHGPFSPGGPIDAGYILFLFGCGAAALHPSMADLAVAHEPVAARRPRGRLVLLGAAAVLAPGVQMIEWFRGHPIEVPVVAAGSIVMFLLIVAQTQGLTREVTVQDERRLLGRVLQAAEDERTRIAHDLHDGPVLRPPVLDNRGFGEALDEHARRFEQETGIAVDVGLGLEARCCQRSRRSCTGSPRSRYHPGVAEQRGQARQGQARQGDRRPDRRRQGPAAGPRRRGRLRRQQHRPAAAPGPLRAGRHAGADKPGRRHPRGRLPARAWHHHRGAAADPAARAGDGLSRPRKSANCVTSVRCDTVAVIEDRTTLDYSCLHRSPVVAEVSRLIIEHPMADAVVEGIDGRRIRVDGLVDHRAHRSIQDAAVIAGARGATVRRFRSGDVEHARRRLRGPFKGPGCCAWTASAR
jgi:signal transduction histidine kinase